MTIMASCPPPALRRRPFPKRPPPRRGAGAARFRRESLRSRSFLLPERRSRVLDFGVAGHREIDGARDETEMVGLFVQLPRERRVARRDRDARTKHGGREAPSAVVGFAHLSRRAVFVRRDDDARYGAEVQVG